MAHYHHLRWYRPCELGAQGLDATMARAVICRDCGSRYEYRDGRPVDDCCPCCGHLCEERLGGEESGR